IDAYKMLRTSGPRGRELADVLDGRETRVRFSSRIQGGFTLNFINTIFFSSRIRGVFALNFINLFFPPPPADPNSDWYFKYLVTLLGHEACHVEQRYWVDSVQQEMRAYASQVRFADELNFNPGPIKDHFADLDPDSPGHQRIAHQAMITLFA